MNQNPLFMELLVSRGIVGQDAGRRLLRRYHDDCFAVLMHLARMNPHQKTLLARIWADSIGVAHVDLQKTLFQREVVQRLPEAFARKNHLILLYQFGEAVTAATSDPANPFMLREAQSILGCPVSPVFSFPDDIEAAIEVEYKSEQKLRDLSSRIVTDSVVIEDISELTRDELQKIAGSQAVVEFVQGLLLLGVREGASDIHVEPGEDKVRIRFRIDGVLQEKSKIERSLLPPLVSRLKILADLNITEKRRPQDGRLCLTLPNRTIDFRFSSVPTSYGEKIVLRVLGQMETKDVPDLTDLSFSRANLDALERVMTIPYGIFFVTGPTGSGKTTTLFSMLKHLNRPGVNITTIEDPIEYRLPGINQIQVNTAVELDFPAALRAFLRQDPDVILVGEIRDVETAEIACRAALTGHLVLATLHTNNAVQALTRLNDMGVQPYMVAPSMVGVLAQRLVRKICDHCREPYTPDPEAIRSILAVDGQEVILHQGRGCLQCGGTGYSGRIAIHELIVISDDIRTLISRGASLTEIHHCAAQAGFQSMRYDGMKKVLRGLTTLEEIQRVTVADDRSITSDGMSTV
ncbi:MAG: GspE/PulE family protein [Syntrophobacteraceae bacterium]|jgi:type IV pilus assembly protein PilB|nr:GspE/PulE family protein [Syntrophobacteraceae bacterium]